MKRKKGIQFKSTHNRIYDDFFYTSETIEKLFFLHFDTYSILEAFFL